MRPPARNQRRAYNAAEAALAEEELDALVAEELEGWQAQIEPILTPVEQLAAEAETPEAFIAGLPALMANGHSAELLHRLALAAFKARALGDRPTR